MVGARQADQQDVAQPGRAPLWESGGRRIEACRPDQSGEVAQSAERRTLNAKVLGSKPSFPAIMTTWPNVEAGGCNPPHAG